jgi:hypothetical protein
MTVASLAGRAGILALLARESIFGMADRSPTLDRSLAVMAMPAAAALSPASKVEPGVAAHSASFL